MGDLELFIVVESIILIVILYAFHMQLREQDKLNEGVKALLQVQTNAICMLKDMVDKIAEEPWQKSGE